MTLNQQTIIYESYRHIFHDTLNHPTNPQVVITRPPRGNSRLLHRATEDPTKAAATGTGGAGVAAGGAAPPWKRQPNSHVFFLFW